MDGYRRIPPSEANRLRLPPQHEPLQRTASLRDAPASRGGPIPFFKLLTRTHSLGHGTLARFSCVKEDEEAAAAVAAEEEEDVDGEYYSGLGLGLELGLGFSDDEDNKDDEECAVFAGHLSSSCGILRVARDEKAATREEVKKKKGPRKTWSWNCSSSSNRRRASVTDNAYGDNESRSDETARKHVGMPSILLQACCKLLGMEKKNKKKKTKRSMPMEF